MTFYVVVLTNFFALFSNGEKSENPVLDLHAEHDHHQNPAHSDLSQVACSCKTTSFRKRVFWGICT